MSKSYVTLEQKVCLICTETKDTGALLMDRHMRDRFEKDTVTGMNICQACEEQSAKGFIALLGVDSDASTITNKRISPEDAYRTAEYVWLRRSVAKEIINIDLSGYKFAYVDQAVIDMLKENER